jgi:nitrite reductase (NADH) small subunit
MPHVDLLVAELPPDKLVSVEREGMKLVAMRSGDRFFAFLNVCPHAFWPLSEGSLRDGLLECAGHGWEFDVETGRCLNAPVYCLTPLSVTLKGDTVRMQWNDAGACSAKPEALRSCPG